MKYYYLHLTKKQIVLIALIVVIMELLLSLWVQRTEFTSDPNSFVIYTGLPFETIKTDITIAFHPGLEWYEGYIKGGSDSHPGFELYKRQQHHTYPEGTLDPILSPLDINETREYLWSGMILNTMFFAVFSLGIVKLAVRIRDEIEYRRYCKLENALK